MTDVVELVEAAPIQRLLIAYLAVQAKTYGLNMPVAATVPRGVTESVTIWRNAGGMRDLVTDSSLMVVECRAGSLDRGEFIANRVRAVIHGMEGAVLDGHVVYEVDEADSGPVNLPEPQSAVRWTQGFRISVRAHVLTVGG